MGYALEELLSPKELAAHVGWTVRRIRNLISANQIHHIRIGGNIFAPKDAIDKYIQANMVEPCLDQVQGLDSSSASKNRIITYVSSIQTENKKSVQRARQIAQKLKKRSKPS